MKVGDKVLITDNLKKLIHKGYDIVNEMLDYAGKTTTIKTVYNSENNLKYDLDIDDGEYYWHPELLTSLVSQMSYSNQNNIKKENEAMDNVKEGFVIFNKIGNKYVDDYFSEVDDFDEVKFYDFQEEVQNEFDNIEEPENFTIRQIKISVEVIKEFERKVTFEEVKNN